jgi:predicted nucleotidyltransferase
LGIGELNQLESHDKQLAYDESMAKTPLLTPLQREHWQRRWASEAGQLQQRRRQLLEVAATVASELRAQWPEVSLWLFGSSLVPGFHADSDLDLAVAQLPAGDLIEALDLAQRCAGRELDRHKASPVALDLVRLEALPLCWQERIQRDGQPLR